MKIIGVAISTGNILLSAEQEVDYIGGSGYRFLSCDFVNLDISLLASVRKILDVCITVAVRKEDGTLLATQDFDL